MYVDLQGVDVCGVAGNASVVVGRLAAPIVTQPRRVSIGKHQDTAGAYIRAPGVQFLTMYQMLELLPRGPYEPHPDSGVGIVSAFPPWTA